MALGCCLPNCNTTYKNKLPEVVLHKFPKNIALKRKWLEHCPPHVETKLQSGSSRNYICSLHFESHAYNVSGKTLNSTAVPTLNLPGQAWKKYYSNVETPFGSEDSNSTELLNTSEIPSRSINDVSNSSVFVQELQIENEELKTNLAACQIKLANTERDKQAAITKLQDFTLAYNEMEKKVLMLETFLRNYESRFTCTQNHIIQNKLARPKEWLEDDVATSFALRAVMKSRGYEYIRTFMQIPLPGLSTSQNWSSNIDVLGTCYGILRLMDTVGLTMSDRDRVCIMTFDEMKVETTYEYEKKNEQIMGPHKKLQLVQVRGLFSSWKQPIKTGFDMRITPDVLTELLTELHKIKYHLVGIVSDQGPENEQCFRQLGICDQVVSFPHPVSQEPVFIFRDYPHLIKNLRNHLVDNKIYIDGKLVSIEPIRRILEEQDNLECRPLYKMSTDTHLDLQGGERQRVAPAVQLLSHTVGCAIQKYSPPTEDTELLEELILTTDKWFDARNSFRTYDKNPLKCAYGVNLDLQNNALDSMTNLMHRMHVMVRTKTKTMLSVLPFQHGIIQGNESVKQFLLYLRAKYDIHYILGNRTNQDCTENTISELRGRGGLNDHPTPLEALNRLKLIMLGRQFALKKYHTNTLPDTENEYLLRTKIKVLLQPLEEDDNSGDDETHQQSPLTPLLDDECDIFDIPIAQRDDQESSVIEFESEAEDEVCGESCTTESDMIPDEESAYIEFETDDELENGSEINQNVNITRVHQMEFDSLEYVAGWVAKKHRSTHPTLGTPTG
jgi:hypothetical protein